MANQIEGIDVATDLLRKFVQEYTLACQLINDGLFAVGISPCIEEGAQRRVRSADRLAGVVLK
jgi:hypothetical protein